MTYLVRLDPNEISVTVDVLWFNIMVEYCGDELFRLHIDALEPFCALTQGVVVHDSRRERHAPEKLLAVMLGKSVMLVKMFERDGIGAGGKSRIGTRFHER